MAQSGMTRRQFLRLTSIGIGGLALGSRLGWALAQSSVYADEVALSMDEIAQIRASGLRFGFNVNQTITDYSRLLIRTARQVASDYGIELVVNDANNSSSAQAAVMTSQVTLDYDGIFAFAVDAEALSDAVVFANNAHTPVVVAGGAPSRGQLVALMNSTNYLGCYQAASALTQASGGSGKIAVVSAGFDLPAYREGERGVITAISESKMALVDLQAVVDESAARQAVAALLSAHPDLTAIFATWGEALDGALAALDAAGSTVKLAGYGAELDAFNAFAANDERLIAVAGERADVTARAAIDALCRGVLGQTVAPEVLVPTLMVTPANFRDRWNELYPDVAAPWAAEATAAVSP